MRVGADSRQSDGCQGLQVVQEFVELLVADLCLTQDAFERPALEFPVQGHWDRGAPRLAHDDVASGLADVLPASALQQADKLSAGKDGKALGHPQRLCGSLDIAWYPHLDWHDGRSGIDMSPVGRVFEQQLDSLDEVGFRLLDRVALAHHVQLKAAGYIPGTFLVNRSSQAHANSVAPAVRGSLMKEADASRGLIAGL
jgi:hypothetical protein